MLRVLRNAILSLGLVLQFALLAEPAIAQCDPNESCNRCLVSAFGQCVTRGNDPICEARKAACQANIPLPPSPADVLDDVQQCLSDIQSCPATLLSGIGYEAVRPIVDAYIGYLRNQVGSYFVLDPYVVQLLQPYYPEVDLNAVRYAFNVDTLHGQHITIGSEIYFVGSLNFLTMEGAEILFHELEHVVQYARRGGIDNFMSEYLLKSLGSMLKGGNSVDIHDNIEIEGAANAKASQVLNAIGPILAPGQQQFPQQQFPQQQFPQQQFPPQQMVMGNRCFVDMVNWCPLPGYGAAGSPCYCGTPMGPIWGIVQP